MPRTGPRKARRQYIHSPAWLARHRAIREASEALNEAVDQLFMIFVGEVCMPGETYARPLYRAYVEWSCDPVSEVKFAWRMARLGYRKRRRSRGQLYLTVGLR